MPSANRPRLGLLARALSVLGLLLVATPSDARLLTLTGGHRVVSRNGTTAAKRRTTVTFRADALLDALPAPTCPTTSSLRIVADAFDSGELPLPCSAWAIKGVNHRYTGAPDAAGGVRDLRLGRGKLTAKLEGAGHSPIPSAASFVEVRFTVGADEACGRFLVVTGAAAGSPLLAVGPSSACSAMPRRPSFLLVYLDDTRADGIDLMPVVQSRLVGEGHSFPNAFTPNSVCCPSRASVLTGLYALRHGTRALYGPIGGAARFRELGADQQTIAVWLQEAGYRTGMFGKYLNGYSAATEGGLGPNGGLYVPPGWDRWWAITSPETMGGVYGKTYAAAQEDGSLTVYDDHLTDAQYSTDLSAEKLREFVTAAVTAGEPFFAYWAPMASHSDGFAPPAPAARHFGSFDDLPLWRPPSWDEPDDGDKPRWVVNAPDDEYGLTDLARTRGSEALLAVDEQLGAFLDLVESLGVADDTMIVFTSDNGVTWGEHGLFLQGKGCPYDECQRVPFVVRYPRLGTSPTVHTEPVLNLDIAPTMAAFALQSVEGTLDGQNMTPLLAGTPASWRTDYLLEYYRVPCADQLQLTAQPVDGDRVRLWHGEPRAVPRSSTVFEFDAGDGVVQPDAVAVTIRTTVNLTAYALALAVTATVPGVEHVTDFFGRAKVEDTTGSCHAPMWWEEVDQTDAFEPTYPIPAYFGVVDVARGYTWVELETGERELYDRGSDPYQLENRAGDPTYQALATELSARTAALVSEIEARGTLDGGP